PVTISSPPPGLVAYGWLGKVSLPSWPRASMHRIATAVGLFLLMSAPVVAKKWCADRGRAQDDRRLHRQDSRRFGTRAEEQMHWADRRPMRRRTWRQTPSASSLATCASRQSRTPG